MLMVILFGVFGIGFLFMGGSVMASAPAVTQEMAGILLILCGVVSLGFGAVLSVLNQIRKDAQQ